MDRARSGEYSYQGIFVKYTFENGKELLFIEGPTPADLTIQVYRSQQAPAISYSYFTVNHDLPSGI